MNAIRVPDAGGRGARPRSATGSGPAGVLAWARHLRTAGIALLVCAGLAAAVQAALSLTHVLALLKTRRDT